MIDFDTLQGLTIPEGVVAEIKDASGRVIWGAAAQGVLYLRPSADISLGHPIYPDTLSTGYLAISEAVSDGSSTYIGYSGTTNVSATSKFAMSLQGKHKIRRVTSAKFIFNGNLDGDESVNTGICTASCSCSVSILGENVFNWVKSSKGTIIYSDTVDMPDFVSVLNNYIGANGTTDLPEVTIEITNSIVSGGKSGTSYVSRIAIELECGR